MLLFIVCVIGLLARAPFASTPPSPSIVVVDTEGHRLEAKILADGPRLTVTAPGFLTWAGPRTSLKGMPPRLVLLRPARLRGRILSQDTVLAGARVRADLEGRIPASGDGSPRAEVRTSKQGIFELERLQPGLRSVTVEAEGHLPQALTLVLREGEHQWTEISLRRPAWLELRLLGPDGKPLGSVEAVPRTEGPDGGTFSEHDLKQLGALSARSDETGRLTLGPLFRGSRHRIVLRREGFAAQSVALVPDRERAGREIRMEPGGRIRLLVRDQSRKAVEGATALLASDDIDDLDLLASPPPTGRDGALTLGPVPARAYSLRLQAPGFRPRTLRGLEVAGGGLLDAGTVILESGLEIRGQVRTDDGGPVMEARVVARFFEEGRSLTSRDRTDAEGRFRVGALPPGEVTIRVESDGFLPETIAKVESGRTDLAVLLKPEGFIAGRVVDARSGEPVPGFVVHVRDAADPPPSRSEVWWTPHRNFEDPDGKFRFEGLRHGTYRVEVEARGCRTASLDGIEVPGTGREILVEMEHGASIEGSVVDAEDNRPIASARVGAYGVPEVVTDPMGRFRLDGLEERATLIVNHPLYIPERMLDVSPAGAGEILVRLRRGGSLEGTIYGAGAVPLPGAVVLAEGLIGARDAVTDGAGRYRFDGLPPGNRQFSKVDRPGTLEGYETAMVRIETGATAGHDFGLGIRLQGMVTFAGNPASAAILTFTLAIPPAGSLSMPNVSVRAGESGQYEARGLHPGAYTVLITYEDRRVGRQVVIEAGAGEQRIDFEIPDLRIGGQLVDADTRDPIRGRVIARPKGAAGGGAGSFARDGVEIEYSSFPRSTTETDARGRFRLHILEAGPHRLYAFVDGYRMDESLEVDVRQSRDDLVVALQPAIEVRVTAIDAATGAELDSLECVQVFHDQFWSARCGTGATSIGGLRPGPTYVGASASGYAPAYRAVTLEHPRHEMSIPLTRGGSLRLIVPADLNADLIQQGGYLRIHDAQGIDVTRFMRHTGLVTDSGVGEILIRHLPAGTLRVTLGREETAHPPRHQEVSINEETAAVADLR